MFRMPVEDAEGRARDATALACQDGISGVHRTRRTLATAALCVPAGLVVTAITCRVAVGWSAAGGDTAAHRTAVAVQGAATAAACPQ